MSVVLEQDKPDEPTTSGARMVNPQMERNLWLVSQAMIELPGAKTTEIQRHLAEQNPPFPVNYNTLIGYMREVWVWWRRRRLEQFDDMVAAETAKLDRLEAELWPLIVGETVVDKDGKSIKRPKSMDAVLRLLQVAERRARLLGLDAPAKQQQSVNVHIVRGEPVRAPIETVETVDHPALIEGSVVAVSGATGS